MDVPCNIASNYPSDYAGIQISEGGVESCFMPPCPTRIQNEASDLVGGGYSSPQVLSPEQKTTSFHRGSG